MNTLYIKVAPGCEGVVTALGRGRNWSIESEDYNADGRGLIEVSYNHDNDPNSTELSGYEEQALNSHPGVVEYWTR